MYEDLAAAIAQQAPETGAATVNPLMLAKALRQRAGKVDAVPDTAQTWEQVAGRMGDTIQQTFGGMDVRNPESVTPEGIAGIVGALGPQIIAKRLAPGLVGNGNYAYHATNGGNLFDIASSGKLNVHRPNYGTDQSRWPDGALEKRAYFGSDPKHLYQFAPENGTPVVVRTKLTGEIFRESTGDLFARKAVDAKKLEFLGVDNQWHSLDKLTGIE